LLELEAKQAQRNEHLTGGMVLALLIAAIAGAKQREALDRVYNAIDELKLPASFEGKESEIAKLNRDIAGAW
jgi:hypothetical protein